MSSIALGATIVDALVGVGVTDVVLAPGSRSAALALADLSFLFHPDPPRRYHEPDFRTTRHRR